MSALVPAAETQFGIYVHWPFCAAKCPYCDFNSHVRQATPDEARFAAAFAQELAHAAARGHRQHRSLAAPSPVPLASEGHKTVTSIFFGGGTPSLMKPATVEAILSAISKHWSIAEGAEITLEANPSSVEAERFRGYRSAGVNRLSLGVQALDDASLKSLGRLHDSAQARRAVELARTTFPRLSFDLIYARPGQSLAAWEAELRAALALAADHLSLYQLTIEPETPFARLFAAGKLAVPDTERSAEFYELTQAITEAHGLPAYEISNHAEPGAESRHNLTYWRYRDYVGVGPGAHGRLTFDGAKRATLTEKHPERWLERVESRGSGLVSEEPLSAAEAADEMLLMGLRLREGIDPARYLALAGRTGFSARLHMLLEHGLVETLPSGRLRATSAGWLVLNSVVAELAA
jgi:putative oxygen-independent coproporphyrinogen III oxidase